MPESPLTSRVCSVGSDATAVPTLHTLEVSGDSGIYGCVAHSLASALWRLTELRALQLHWEDDHVAVLAEPLRQLTALTRLAICIDTFYCRGAVFVLESTLTCLSRLADLSLACGCEVTELGWALGTLTTLTSLDLSYSGVQMDSGDDEEGVDRCHDARELALGLCPLSQLAALTLANTYDGSGGAAALAPALSQLTALTALDLSENYIDADDAAALAPALSRLSRLADLNLHSNELGAAGAAALAPSIALLTALTRLHLDCNGVGADGAAALAPALSRLARLAHLDLASNALGAAGAAAFPPPLGGLTALVALNLRNNNMLYIGDEGLRQLAPALTRLTRLKQMSLKLGVHGFCDSTVDALRAQLPASVWEATDLHADRVRQRKRPRAAAS